MAVIRPPMVVKDFPANYNPPLIFGSNRNTPTRLAKQANLAPPQDGFLGIGCQWHA
jgi:hypothetical protein